MLHHQMTKQLKLRIADIIIEARCVGADIGLGTSQASRPFLVSEGQPDCVLNVHYGPLPEMELERKLFDLGSGGWALYSNGKKLIFKLLAGHEQPYPYRLAVFGPRFDRGELFICPRRQLPFSSSAAPPPERERASLDPFLYPLDELLMVNLLARRRGLHIHACGVVYQGGGLAFCGVSGAGKSTLAELWKRKEVRILSDDRLILRKQGGNFWVHGTPWHGDARISLPEKAPLKAIYFIKHAQENRIVPLSATDIATRLLVRSFPTFYSEQGMEYTLGFIADISQKIPCYELEFVPDARVIEQVLNHVGVMCSDPEEATSCIASCFDVLTQEILARGSCLRFKASGHSMYPFIQSGDVLLVEPAGAGELNFGDIVLYRRAWGTYVVHRLIGRGNGSATLITKGDDVVYFDAPVPAEQVLGRVIQIERCGRQVRLKGRPAQALNWFLARLSPSRRCAQTKLKRGLTKLWWLIVGRQGM